MGGVGGTTWPRTKGPSGPAAHLCQESLLCKFPKHELVAVGVFQNTNILKIKPIDLYRGLMCTWYGVCGEDKQTKSQTSLLRTSY